MRTDEWARHHHRNGHVQPVRTVSAAVVGGTTGAVALGALAAYLVSDGAALATLGAAIAATAAGSLIGVCIALAIQLRHHPVQVRAVAIVSILVVGPALGAITAWTISQTALYSAVDARHLLVAWQLIVLPASALVGRWLAARTAPHQ